MRKWIYVALVTLCLFCISGAVLAASAVTPDGYFNGIRLAGKVRLSIPSRTSASNSSIVSLEFLNLVRRLFL